MIDPAAPCLRTSFASAQGQAKRPCFARSGRLPGPAHKQRAARHRAISSTSAQARSRERHYTAIILEDLKSYDLQLRNRDETAETGSAPAASTPCTWKTDFAMANPMTRTSAMALLLDQRRSRSGLAPPGVEGRPKHQSMTAKLASASPETGPRSAPSSHLAAARCDLQRHQSPGGLRA